MKRLLAVMIVFVSAQTAISGPTILSLDGSRTGDEAEPGGDRYLTSPAMFDATQVLTNAGFTIGTTSLFTQPNISGSRALYTGAVNVDFTAQEITDIQSFVGGGGGLIIQRDWGNYYPAADSLAASFGVTYSPGPYGSGVGVAVNMTTNHPIWNGPAGSVTSYDQVFSSSVSGITGIGNHSSNPDQIALGYTFYGLGRVVFLTDMDAWDSFGDPISPVAGSNNAIVWENIFHWAGGTPVIPAPGAIALGAIGVVVVGWLRRRRTL